MLHRVRRAAAAPRNVMYRPARARRARSRRAGAGGRRAAERQPARRWVPPAGAREMASLREVLLLLFGLNISSAAASLPTTSPTCSRALQGCWPVKSDHTKCRACESTQQGALHMAGCTEGDIAHYCSPESSTLAVTVDFQIRGLDTTARAAGALHTAFSDTFGMPRAYDQEFLAPLLLRSYRGREAISGEGYRHCTAGLLLLLRAAAVAAACWRLQGLGCYSARQI
eukprot:COSAG05_NODE_957_length_6426_cov_16.557768_6_plen_227_part_00